MKTLQSLPQYTMRWLYLDLNQQRRGEEGKNREPQQSGGGWGGWGLAGGFLLRAYIWTIIQPSFCLPRNSVPKSVKWKTNVVGEPAQGLKTFLLFHDPTPEKSWLRGGIKKMSRQRLKSKSASTSQNAEEYSKTGPLKMYWYLKKRFTKGLYKNC